MNNDYDLLIIGGGMVGASLVRAIAGRGWRIGVVEPFALDSDRQPSYDERVIALAYGSRKILSGVGVWPSIAPAAEPILDIHISDRGHFGFTRFHHGDAGVAALGYVVAARVLGQALFDGLRNLPDVELLCPARLEDFRIEGDRVEARVQMDGVVSALNCRLLVAADGAESMVRKRSGIKVREWRYGQTAIVANITPGKDHRGTAYERFTDTGPLAVLPMTEGRCSVVWTQKEGQAASIMSLDDQRFLEQLQARFGYRLGPLQQVGRRFAYPLRLMLARQQVGARVALAGNAGHTVHPVAGQGFNLGLRDVAVLAELLVDAAQDGGDPGSETLLRRYADLRRPDLRMVGLMTDGLARLFTNPLAPVHLARNLGLATLDLLPPVKQLLLRRFMGLHGKPTRLARGVPLD